MNKEIAELIGEIQKVSVEITLDVNNEIQIFARFSGHTGDLEVEVFLCGWQRNLDADMKDDIRIYDCQDEIRDTVIKELKNVRDTLYKLRKNGKTNLDNKQYKERIVRDYSLCNKRRLNF